MNSLLRTVNSMSNRKNMLVRESLQQQLNTSVIEMQSAPGVLEDKSVGVCDEAMILCSTLEAIFLHGLKDSLLNRVTEALSGPDFDAMPQPSFWGPLLVFSHSQMINQIQGLTQVRTEVGYCRAWIRMALNEGLLSSYLASIRRDNSALKPYYNRAAFIRDADLLEVAERLIESIDYIQFELVCNSSLLNFWSSTPLMMAAIWSPPMKSCPVFSAVDIAKTINSEMANDSLDEIETASSIGSLGSISSSRTALNSAGCVSEDEALRIILMKKHNQDPSHCKPTKTLSLPSSPLADRNKHKKENDNEEKSKETKEPVKPENKPVTSEDVIADTSNSNRDITENITKVDMSAVGNSLIGKLGWSTSYEDCESSMTSSAISQNSGTEQTQQTQGEGPTYDALLKSYHTGGYKSPNLEEFIEKYPTYHAAAAMSVHEPDLIERASFDDQLGRLPREKGLDLQNYTCLDCEQSIGLTFNKAHVCFFTGDYFCTNCMATEEYLIPSRVIHNWDLRRYAVCHRAAECLSSCSTLLDLKVLNPRIYTAVDTMAQLQLLRVQLNMLRAYLYTCREPVIEALQEKVGFREYLYEHIHLYSVSDLTDISNGTLAQQLQHVIEFAKNHVINCWLCSQKGFICEVCNIPKIIYPFEMQSTYRCASCNAVFHADCLNASKPCPKCERRRNRQDNILNADNSDILHDAVLPPSIIMN